MHVGHLHHDGLPSVASPASAASSFQGLGTIKRAAELAGDDHSNVTGYLPKTPNRVTIYPTLGVVQPSYSEESASAAGSRRV
jgi:hypothetical protein